MGTKSFDELSYSIRGAAFDVYNELEPGLLESVYEKAMLFELSERGHDVESQLAVAVEYKGIALGSGMRLDLLVDGLVVVEIKSIEKLLSVHHKQLLTYMKLENLKLGLLMNFNAAPFRIVRLVNNL